MRSLLIYNASYSAGLAFELQRGLAKFWG